MKLRNPLLVVFLLLGLFQLLVPQSVEARINAQGTGGRNDTIPPVITIIGGDTVHVEILGNYVEYGAVAIDNIDGNLSAKIVLHGSVDTKTIGVYYLDYSVQDVAGNKASKTRIVIVGDTEKPIISNSDAIDSNIVLVLAGSIFINRTKVTDNYDTPMLIETVGSNGNVNSKILGRYPMIYNATDKSGNKADTKVFIFIVGDYLGPNIILNTSDTILWPVNVIYTSTNPTLKDNFYDASQITLNRVSNVNAFKLGLYFEEYTATDGSGNTTKRKRWVRVVDIEPPVISGKALAVAKFSTPDFKAGLVITDNYDSPVNLFQRLTEISNNVNTSVDGVYSVVFQVSDFSGNKSAPFERFVLVGSVAVKSISKEPDFKLYPNPSNGIITMEFLGETPENLLIEVFNATGKLVATVDGEFGNNGLQMLDLSNLSSGLYTVKITTPHKTGAQKIVIQK